jgi:hypothetical protein
MRSMSVRRAGVVPPSMSCAYMSRTVPSALPYAIRGFT